MFTTAAGFAFSQSGQWLIPIPTVPLGCEITIARWSTHSAEFPDAVVISRKFDEVA
jgi:hypothetical protein